MGTVDFMKAHSDIRCLPANHEARKLIIHTLTKLVATGLARRVVLTEDLILPAKSKVMVVAEVENDSKKIMGVTGASFCAPGWHRTDTHHSEHDENTG